MVSRRVFRRLISLSLFLEWNEMCSLCQVNSCLWSVYFGSLLFDISQGISYIQEGFHERAIPKCMGERSHAISLCNHQRVCVDEYLNHLWLINSLLIFTMAGHTFIGHLVIFISRAPTHIVALKGKAWVSFTRLTSPWSIILNIIKWTFRDTNQAYKVKGSYRYLLANIQDHRISKA